MQETSIGGLRIAFQPTLWTTVGKAREAGGEEARAALGRIIERYWKPLYFFARRKGCDVERAKDLTQAFFERLIERDFLKDVVPEKGRFRSWLLGAMTHFLADARDRECAQKRGGGRVVSLDVEPLERTLAGAEDSAERLFTRAWATEVFESSLARLRAEWAEREFEVLVRHLGGEGEGLRLAAEQLGVELHDMKNRIHKMRQKLRQYLREELSAWVEDPRDIDDELAELWKALGK